MRELLGGKGANLAEMTNLELTCSWSFYNYNQLVHSTMRMDDISIRRFLIRLWKLSQKWKRLPARNSVIKNPLLYPFRSGARSPCRHDGHNPESRIERGSRSCPGEEVRQSKMGLGLLQTIYPDVFRCRYGSGQEVFLKNSLTR